ncbi:MAG: prolipoprotein diacylglyceryl transferase [Saprospiraceae bacterium]|nr:prolipoprotein diacylglyceryl transferase [Saprospiraceae bacterium]
MYPDLSYIAHALFGTAPDNGLSILKTFGFFLAIAFLTSAIVYYHELKRKAAEGFFQPSLMTITEGKPASMGEILSNVVVGFLMLGKGVYAYQHYEVFRHDPASIILSSKINWLAGIVGAAALGFLTWWDANRKRKDPPELREVKVWPHDRISEMTVWAAIGGIVGAKVFDLFDNWQAFLEDPVGSLTSGGGLAFLGGLVLGFIAVVSYMYKHNIPFLPSADAVAPALTAGYGVGRIGCQLSGDGDWGIVNNAPKPDWMSFLPDWMWSFSYPHHVLNTVHTDPVHSVAVENCSWDYCFQLSEPVYPTPFYEIMMMIVIFGILWALRKRIKVPGMLFFIYLALIAVERSLIEKIRVNVIHNVLGMQLTQAEIISFLLLVISVAGGVYVWRRHKKSQEAVVESSD